MNICVLGLGYIGFPTACLFANANHKVIGVDINQETIRKINHGQLPFVETGLEALFENAYPNMRFKIANKHPRVNVLKPGPGVGGHCIAIDPWFLTENTTRCRIVSLAREINNGMPNHVLQILKRLVDGIKDPVITVFGVAYKGGVDDTRETPALKFIKLAENEGYKVKVHDPHVEEFEYKILGLEESVRNSDCIVLITDHLEFKEIDPKKISALMSNKNVVDTRKMLDTQQWKEAGFNVKVLGYG